MLSSVVESFAQYSTIVSGLKFDTVGEVLEICISFSLVSNLMSSSNPSFQNGVCVRIDWS